MEAERLTQFKESLEERLRELLGEADRTVSGMSDAIDTFPDPTDRATLETDRNFMLRIRDRERKLISKIKEALERIEDGTYGLCEACGEPIGEKRLHGPACDHLVHRVQSPAGKTGTGARFLIPYTACRQLPGKRPFESPRQLFLPGRNQTTMSDLIDLKELTQTEFEELVTSWGQAPFRARQVQKWLYKGVTDFEAMTDIGREIWELLLKNHLSVIWP